MAEKEGMAKKEWDLTSESDIDGVAIVDPYDVVKDEWVDYVVEEPEETENHGGPSAGVDVAKMETQTCRKRNKRKRGDK